MSLSLLALPPTILGSILSFNGTSEGALRLWLSGSRALQSKLAAGIVRIKLVNYLRHIPNRWPSFIENLRSLRELTIDRSNNAILYNKKIQKEVQKLPSTLRKLRLRILGSIRVLEPSSPSTHDSAETLQSNSVDHHLIKPSWTFASAFPNLESLELDSKGESWTAHDFSLLPPTITQMAIRPLPIRDCESFLSLLPPQILSLKANTHADASPDSSFWMNLPPALTALKGGVSLRDAAVLPLATRSEIATRLPRSLTELSSALRGFEPVTSLLPPSLTSMCLDSSFDPLTSGIASLGQQFNKLRSLTTGQLSPSFLLSLPPSLAVLFMTLGTTPIKREDWPKSLLHLELDRSSNDHGIPSYPFSILPHTLITLSIYDMVHFKDFVLLPHTLVSLSCGKAVVCDQVEFPPNLKQLYLAHCENLTPQWLRVESEDDETAY